MPSNRHGMSTAFCVLAVSSQSETKPSIWRMENHTVNKVSDEDFEKCTDRGDEGCLRLKDKSLCIERHNSSYLL